MSIRDAFDWCMTHDSLASANPGQCFSVSIGHGDEADCRFEGMRLVPVDSLVVSAEMFGAVLVAVDAIDQLDEGIEAGGDIADESEAVYEAARELRGHVQLLAGVEP